MVRNNVTALARSAQTPSSEVTLVILVPIVFTIFQPPVCAPLLDGMIKDCADVIDIENRSSPLYLFLFFGFFVWKAEMKFG